MVAAVAGVVMVAAVAGVVMEVAVAVVVIPAAVDVIPTGGIAVSVLLSGLRPSITHSERRRRHESKANHGFKMGRIGNRVPRSLT